MKSQFETRRGQYGFSLLELLVALVILALIMGVVAPRMLGYVDRAKSQTAAAQIDNIESSLNLYLLDVGRFPTEQEGLSALIEAPESVNGWNGPYLDEEEVPLDPWGQPYHYAMTPEMKKPKVYSYGKDNVEGGEGDNADIGL